MPAIELRPDIYWVGVNDKTTDLFEGLWPIANEGVSYNAYMINDKKKVIIDLAKAFKSDEFFNKVGSIVDIASLDYAVLNHMEPDHSGALCKLLKMAPHLTILCSEKAVDMLNAFYGVKKNIVIVRDGEILDLGKHQIQFFMTPFVHWPETMMTYEQTQKILFSCDGFGGYGSLADHIFDDTCMDPEFYINESLRYFVNIVAKFSAPVLNAINKLGGLSVEIIAPSHGLIWRKNPGRIIQLYKTWSECASGNCSSGITLIYGSMYGNTEKMLGAVSQGISETGMNIEVFDATKTHISYILPSLWMNRGIMIGAPTYEGQLFPPVLNVLEHALLKRVLNKETAYFGSYGWNGGALRNLQLILKSLKWHLTDQLTFKGEPDDQLLKQGMDFGTRFAKMIMEKA